MQGESKEPYHLIDRKDPASLGSEGPLRITLLANAGVLIESEQVRILVDGLHDSENTTFGRLSPTLTNDLLQGKPPHFDRIDHILFTHGHPDHFSAPLLQMYLAQHPVRSLWLPKSILDHEPNLRALCSDLAYKPVLLDVPLEVSHSETVTTNQSAGVQITAFRTIHAGKAYADVDHFCYLVKMGGKSILIAGDGDYDVDYYDQMIAGHRIDAALVNPLFLRLFAGRKVVMQAIRPAQLLVYHIPFQDQDPQGFRGQVIQDKQRNGANLPPLTILWDELQTVEI